MLNLYLFFIKKCFLEQNVSVFFFFLFVFFLNLIIACIYLLAGLNKTRDKISRITFE